MHFIRYISQGHIVPAMVRIASADHEINKNPPCRVTKVIHSWLRKYLVSLRWPATQMPIYRGTLSSTYVCWLNGDGKTTGLSGRQDRSHVDRNKTLVFGAAASPARQVGDNIAIRWFDSFWPKGKAVVVLRSITNWQLGYGQCKSTKS